MSLFRQNYNYAFPDPLQNYNFYYFHILWHYSVLGHFSSAFHHFPFLLLSGGRTYRFVIPPVIPGRWNFICRVLFGKALLAAPFRCFVIFPSYRWDTASVPFCHTQLVYPSSARTRLCSVRPPMRLSIGLSCHGNFAHTVVQMRPTLRNFHHAYAR